jgi:hypothetical protein
MNADSQRQNRSTDFLVVQLPGNRCCRSFGIASVLEVIAVVLLLAACGSSGLRVRTGVASLELDKDCARAETSRGAGWSGMEFCFRERNDRTLGIFASLAAPDYSPQGLALLAKPETDLEFFLKNGRSFHAKTDVVGFLSLEVKTKSPIAYFLIRYSPTELVKCDAELGGPVCEPAP